MSSIKQQFYKSLIALFALPRFRGEKFAVDTILWVISVPTAFLIRYENEVTGHLNEALLYLVLILPGRMVVLHFAHLNRRPWRKTNLQDMAHLGITIVATFLVSFILTIILLNPLFGIPRSIPIIEAMLTASAMAHIRILVRIVAEYHNSREVTGKQRSILIIGAGEAGTTIAHEMMRHPNAGMKPIGFLDDDTHKHRQMIMGLPVHGSIDDLAEISSHRHIDEILIAVPSATPDQLRHIIKTVQSCSIAYRILPSWYDIISGSVHISQIREIKIEDLLRRDPVILDVEQIGSYLQGKVVLITGAGGSIGSEILRQVLKFTPQKVILFGRGENSIHAIYRELLRDWQHVHYELIIADMRDRNRVEYVFQCFQPDVVFHAAAHKHVMLMELNPSEAVFNNICGTRNLVSMALKYNTKYFVNISSDKAVNPTSIMGASKRVTEFIVEQAARLALPEQVFVSVRFGNVLGSRGSVVPIFQEQIRQGGPITVTHPEMRRYFMTIPEAAKLVLQAGGLAQNGVVYVLEMGEMVRIVDLAEDLIMLSGVKQPVDIVFTSVQPGEKLYEELKMNSEEVLESSHKQIKILRHTGLPDDFEILLDELSSVAESGDVERIRQSFNRIVTNYAPFGCHS